MDTKSQIHAGFSGGNSSDFNDPMYVSGGTKLSWPNNIRGNAILIFTELVFTQIFFGVVFVFVYSLGVPAQVAVVLLYDPGQIHTDSPQSLFPLFLFLHCTGL